MFSEQRLDYDISSDWITLEVGCLAVLFKPIVITSLDRSSGNDVVDRTGVEKELQTCGTSTINDSPLRLRLLLTFEILITSTLSLLASQTVGVCFHTSSLDGSLIGYPPEFLLNEVGRARQREKASSSDDILAEVRLAKFRVVECDAAVAADFEVEAVCADERVDCSCQLLAIDAVFWFLSWR